MAKSSSENTLSFIDKLEALWIKKKYYYGVSKYQNGTTRFKIGIDTRNYGIKYKKKPPTDPDYITYVEGIKEMMEQVRGNTVIRKYNGYNFALFTECGDNPLDDIMDLNPTIDDFINLYKKLFFGNINVLKVLMSYFEKSIALLFFVQGHDYFHDNEYEERESNASLINFLSILLQHDCTAEEILGALPKHLQNSPGFNSELNKMRFKESLLATLKDNDLYKKVILLIYDEDNIIKNLYNDVAHSLHLEINTEPMMAQYAFDSVEEVLSGLAMMIQYCNGQEVLTKINHTVDNRLHFGYYFNFQENTHNIIIKGKKEVSVKQIKHLIHLFCTFYRQYRPKLSVNLNRINDIKISDEIRKNFDRLILTFSLEHTLPENEEEISNTSGKI